MSNPDLQITIARAYDLPEHGGEYRVLVDGLWPRGLSKDSLALDGWRKDLAPSAELRRWFGHRPERWEEFRERYARELAGKAEEVASLAAIAAERPVLLIYGTRDLRHNNAIVLRDFLLEGIRG